MTFEERVQALQYLRLTDRQTRFVVTVALHGGYCLRRHYETFAGIAYGAPVREFLDSLVTRSLAQRFQFRRDRGYVYRLHRTGLYDAIGQRENRNRRHVSAAAIARKLMVLDYVLLERHGEWYATEDDKVRLFTDRFGLSRDRLPGRIYTGNDASSTTTRYFVHKLPIHLVDYQLPPSFLYLVTDTDGSGVIEFLRDHLQLLDSLTHWRIVAIAPPHISGLKACELALNRFCQGLRTRHEAAEVEDVKKYFLQRRALERGEVTHLVERGFNEATTEWRTAQRRFGSAEYENLYVRWNAEGNSALGEPTCQRFLASIQDHRGELVTRVLPYQYDRFGTLAGVS